MSAVNTNGTADNPHDTATSYGSRGPTYIDGLFKPDLVAPGNQVTSAGFKDSWISSNFPSLKISDKFIRLSGSSLATAYVSGAVALMLEVNPDLTPRRIKALLVMSAIKLEQPHLLEQGNGLVNVMKAVELAEALDLNSRSLAWEVSPTWQLGGATVWAGGAFATGDRLV